MIREWYNAQSNPPEESGRYWCYVQDVNCLTMSYFQWNCSYNKNENRWNIDKLENRGCKVMRWTYLLDKPF